MSEQIIRNAEITALTNMGAGVTKATDGRTVFAAGAVDGDVCDVKITSVRRSFSLGEVAELKTPSPHRVPPDCAAFSGGCGGCTFRHVTYAHELEVKHAYVASLLKRAGIEALPSPIRSAGEHEPRTKVTVPIGRDGTVGYYKKSSHEPVPCENCRLHSPLTRAMLKETETLLRGLPRTSFHHVCLRHATHGTMLILISSDKGDLPHAKRIFSELSERFGELSSGYFCLRRPSETYGPCTHIGGDEKIRDTLTGCDFLISPDAFYQVNHGSAEILYTLAAEYADAKDGETVADLYCGTGTIGISVLKNSGAKAKLYGIEIVESAVRDARENADANGVDAEFVIGDAADFDRTADVVIVDPPRAGCDERLISHLKKTRPERIVYISCEPATLARDLARLADSYTVTAATPVDMFPRTGHCETVVLLSKGEVDSKKIRVEFSLEDMDMSEFQDGATYPQIKEYVLEHTGLKVSSLYISQIKRKCGLEVGKNYNLPKSEDSRQPQCPPEKEKAIREALKYFGMI